MPSLMRDVRLAWRVLGRRPGLTVVAVVTLALGSGTNTAVNSAARALLGQPFDILDLERVVGLGHPVSHLDVYRVAYPTYLDWKQMTRSFDRLAAYDDAATRDLLGGVTPEQVRVCRVDADFFRVVRATPLLGRALGADEVAGGHETSVLISEGLWRRRFGSNPHIVSTDIRLNDGSYSVVGVLPDGFGFPPGIDLWLPLKISPAARQSRQIRAVNVVGLLRPGVSVAQAAHELMFVHDRLKAAHGDLNRAQQGTVVPLAEMILRQTNSLLIKLVMAASVVVLLLACINVGGLMLVRVAERRRDMATRFAIGATTPLIVRQLAIENLVLAVVGSGCGLVVAALTMAVLKQAPGDLANIPAFHRLHLDVSALGYNVLTLAASTVLVGSFPAWYLARTPLNEVLKDGARGSSQSVLISRLRTVLVATQLTLAVVLGFSAVAFVASLRQTYVNKGFTSTDLLLTRVRLAIERHDTSTKQIAFHSSMVRRMTALAGVADVAAVNSEPFGPTNDSVLLSLDDGQVRGNDKPGAFLRTVSPRYLDVLGMTLLRGRFLQDNDSEGANLVGVVSQEFVRRYLGGRESLGRRISFASPFTPGAAAAWYTIVGVVTDVEHNPGTGIQPTVYVSYRQMGSPRMTYLLRPRTQHVDLAAPVKAAFAAQSSSQAIAPLKAFEQQVIDQMSSLIIPSALLAFFGVLAALLATIALHVTVSEHATRRTREAGIRMALGANGRTIVALIMGQGLRVAVFGAALGVTGGLTGIRVLGRALNLNLEPNVTAVLATVGGLLMLAALSAFLPANRASRVSPLGALRCE
jgi:putative ABC transport system permease protein